ncbi:MAG TPA: glycoside hydrolase family 3 C-terminal domain-containing protein [Acidimicrobiales bacterium]|nr:glycoside hydrolase family 3 C-terminal domain-containing protein [Acidimicrobiales bacterium]
MAARALGIGALSALSLAGLLSLPALAGGATQRPGHEPIAAAQRDPAAAPDEPGGPAPASSRCPWIGKTADSRTPAQLAAEVVARMSLLDKLEMVDLVQGGGYENHTRAIPQLCIPELTLQDGPDGLAFGDTGVTQLPASLGIAASFDAALAFEYGQVLGSEARDQGVDVVQGPNLNLDRIPNSGRAFEAYGEDPLLAAELGVADIEGIQSEGVMAEAKHFTGYTQETDRKSLDQVIPPQELAELYLPPFEAAVEQAHVAAIMCAYGEINSVYTCQNALLLRTLRQWGFTGFVRSDLGAVKDPTVAFQAGMDMIKPQARRALAEAVREGSLRTGALDAAVESILTEMFRFGLVAHPLSGHTDARVDTPAHAAFALQAAERTIVLLKDSSEILPLSSTSSGSVAVIGDDASTDPVTAGHGSAYVVPPFVVTPLAALRAGLGRHVAISYTPGSSADAALPAIPASELTASAATVDALHAPTASRTASPSGAVLTGSGGFGVLEAKGVVDSADETADVPGSGKGWQDWAATLTVPTSGLYTFSLRTDGDSWLYVGGQAVLADPGLHAADTWTVSVPLVAGERYAIALRWFRAGTSIPELGMQDVSPSIARAVAAARRARTAIVFAADYNSEGFDRPTLALPGDEDALIEAVAAVNPRTIVVLNTGGPVLMPWLSRVAAVVEAWYPGEEDGNAVAAVLTGAVDPSGRLPVSFPVSNAQAESAAVTSWPGVDSEVQFGYEGIGYRYYQSMGLTPLFCFGYGLDYTSFSLSSPSLEAVSGGYELSVRVTDTGSRAGGDVVQVYVAMPGDTGQPPHQLVAFSTVSLRAGESTTVSMSIPDSALRSYEYGRWVTESGVYDLDIGQSSADLPLSVSLTIR